MESPTLAIRNSHHIGPLRQDLEPIAKAGLVAFSCVVSKALMTSYKGNKKLFGTDPIAFACPRKGKEPVVWDMSTSSMSFMEIEVAVNKKGKNTTGLCCRQIRQPNIGFRGSHGRWDVITFRKT
jgi:delta1-piperideine-2-carboxylate reductase